MEPTESAPLSDRDESASPSSSSSRSDSASESEGPSLLDLPDEVLGLVFSLLCPPATTWAEIHILLICRRLRTIAERCLYRHLVPTRRIERFETLVKTLANRPDLAESVKSAVLQPLQQWSDPFGQVKILTPENGFPQILPLLPMLPNLARLRIADFYIEEIVQLVGSADTCRHLVDVELAVSDGFWQPVSECDVQVTLLWQHLIRHEKLSRLVFDGWENDRLLPDPTYIHATLPHLRTLILATSTLRTRNTTNLSVLAPTLRELSVALCRTAGQVSVFGTRTGQEIAFQHDLIATAPDSLKTLTVDSSDPATLARILQDLPRLERLELQGWGIEDVRAFWPPLCRSKVETLVLLDKVRVTDAALETLFQHKSNLKTLVLRHGSRSWYSQPLIEHLRCELDRVALFLEDCDSLPVWWTISEGPVALREEMADIQARYGAEWPHGCSSEGLARVLTLAQAAGIAVEGEAVEMFAWDRYVEDELKRAIARRAAHAHAMASIFFAGIQPP